MCSPRAGPIERVPPGVAESFGTTAGSPLKRGYAFSQYAKYVRPGYQRVGLRTRTVFRDAIRLYESVGYERSAHGSAAIDAGGVVYFRGL